MKTVALLRAITPLRLLSILALSALFGCLAFYNLSDYPTTWFDEGVHIHVPETLVRYGEYADRSSDGFRYFGPTLGVGPTVMVPIAAAFKVFGIGLLQARLVIALYLLAALAMFYLLGRRFGSTGFAAAAGALLIVAPSVAFVETGRQVLGEVPGFFFLLAAFLVWFSAWKGSWVGLSWAGILMGAAAVTKYQNLVVLAPTLGLAFLANAFYYRIAKHRVFIWPGIVLAAVFALWQAARLSTCPQTSAENLAALREATAGAAAVFSPDAMRRGLRELISFGTYGGSLLIALVYGAFCSLARDRRSQQWGTLLLFIVVNLVWYVFASIGWPRYAFAGLALASLFVARFLLDLIGELGKVPVPSVADDDSGALITRGLRVAVVAWAGLIILPALADAQTDHPAPQNSPPR